MKAIVIALLLGSFLMESSRGALIAEVRTSEGNFSIDLNYVGARRTVSHFMRLADGTQPWLDEKTGAIRTGVPFYDGLKFHKKVGGAATIPKYIQTGVRYPDDPFVFIPNDKQGAGFVVRDEIRRNINGNMIVPHGLYTVSMANNGPHSSSSQFFINLINDTWWNDRNSAFGTVLAQFKIYNEDNVVIGVTNGRAVVNAIHSTTQPVTIYSIKFRITDNSPTVFDSSERAGELPVLFDRQISSLAYRPTDLTLHYTPLLTGSETRLWTSVDLFNWTPSPPLTTFAVESADPAITLTHGGVPKGFFKSTVAQYPISTVPARLFGKKIQIRLGKPYANPAQRVIQLNFDEFGIQHDYFVPNASGVLVYGGTFTFTYSVEGPYHADVVITPDGLASETYRLYFGGTNVEPSENENMSARIINSGGDPPTEAHWFYVTP